MDNDKDWLDSREVADLLDVSLKTLKNWRSPEYANSPLHLMGATYRHNRYRYPKSAVLDFAERNPKYRDCILALKFAPPEMLLPRAVSHQVTSALRADAPHTSLTQPTAEWWANFHTQGQPT
jgi:hypothetical protein